MSEEDEGEKEHEASERKLEDARKKGEIPKSADLNTAAGYGGLLLGAMMFGVGSITTIGTGLSVMLDQADTLAEVVFGGTSGPFTGGLLLQSVALAPWFAMPAGGALLAVIAQRSFIVAPDKIEPKLSRISMITNAKNKFGRSGLFEFAKSVTKLGIYGLILALFLTARRDQILGTLHMSPGMIASTLAELLVSFLILVLLISTIIGGIDFFWQRQEHFRKNRMSRKQLQDEMKNSEGDPTTKQKRRQRGINIAMNQMMQSVPDADVVVVNPTHYAVALKWSRAPGQAPICVAKGVDDLAARIRELANENGVPIHRDVATARALYASVEIDQEIWPEHYKAVAAAIKFAEAMRGKAKAAAW